MSINRRIAAFPAMVAMCGVLATPVAAASYSAPADHPMAVADSAWSSEAQTAHKHRRYGWGRGWDRHRHRDRVDAGDVLAGVLIIGGIAAIADAVKDRNRKERHDRYPGDYRYRERPAHNAVFRDRSGLDNAAALCADEVEREASVDAIDSVERNVDGWEVRGTLTDGAGFICRIGPDGRVADVDYSLRRDRPVYRDSEDDRRDGYRD